MQYILRAYDFLRLERVYGTRNERDRPVITLKRYSPNVEVATIKIILLIVDC